MKNKILPNLKIEENSFLKEIRQALKQALVNLEVDFKGEIQLTHPTQKNFGDYFSNLAMTVYKKVNQQARWKSPRDFAQIIVDQLKLIDLAFIKNIEIAGPGFINFYFKTNIYSNFLNQIKKDQLINKTISQQKVVVEYSSPNIAKPFTVGHLRSTIIGDAVANLLEAIGCTIYRDNHLGDWGTQFGKQIYAIKTWGDETKIDQSISPVKELVALYVKFHQEAEKNSKLIDYARAWFKKLEDGDCEAKRLWQKCIDWSWKEFNLIYQKLGVKFTENNGRGYGESFFVNQMDDVIQELINKKLLTNSKGAKLVFFSEDKYPPLMIIKQDGASLYATRDLATDKFRLKKYGKDVIIINEVGAEQQLYFQQLYELENMLSWFDLKQRIHVKHGMYQFKDKKMSTRKGNVIWLEEVIEEAYQRVKKVAAGKIDDKDVLKIAIGALKWNDLKKKSALDVIFDWDEILRIDGNSGPYMQYTCVRCRSILQKITDKPGKLPNNLVLNLDEQALIKLAMRFNQEVLLSALNLAPHQLCTYLYELAQLFNSFYNKHSILQASTDEKKILRIKITKTVFWILQEGLGLLGIESVEKM